MVGEWEKMGERERERKKGREEGSLIFKERNRLPYYLLEEGWEAGGNTELLLSTSYCPVIIATPEAESFHRVRGQLEQQSETSSSPPSQTQTNQQTTSSQWKEKVSETKN